MDPGRGSSPSSAGRGAGRTSRTATKNARRTRRRAEAHSADKASNSSDQPSGESPRELPAHQPDSSPRPSNDDSKGKRSWANVLTTKQGEPGPSNYTGDEPGSSEGNPGGTPAHYNDGGDARIPSSVPFPAPEPAGGQVDELRKFIETRLREYYRPGRQNDASYVESILKDLSAYLEHPEGIDSLLPAKPDQTSNTEVYVHENLERNPRGNRAPAICTVYANYFSLTMEARNTFHLYKVYWIDLENVERDVKEKNWKSIVEAKFNDVRPPPFFDGQSIVLSKMSLMPSEWMEYPVDGNGHNRVRIYFKATVNADDLHNYLVVDRDQRNVKLPLDTIKFANSIMKGYCREMKYVESDRYFYLADEHQDNETLRENVVPWSAYSNYLQRRQGFFQSVRVLEHGLVMNVDFSSAAFWRPVHRLKDIWKEVVKDHLPAEDRKCFRAPNFEFNRDPNSDVFRKQVRVANGYLRNLKIESTHRYGMDRILNQSLQRRRFNIYRVEATNAQSQTVILNRDVGNVRAGGQLSLIQLMCHRDGYKLQQSDLDEFYPPLKVSKTNDYYIPWGCCYTGNESRVGGQLDGKFLGLLKMQITERLNNIKRFRNPIIPMGITLPTRQELYTQISVKEELLEVKPMTLRSYARYPHIRGYDKFVKPAKVERWAYLSFNNTNCENMEKDYLDRLKRKGRNLGMIWTEKEAGMERLSNTADMSATLKRTRVKDTVKRLIERHCREQPLHLIVCFMGKRLAPEYGTLKFLFDIKYGIPSQVIVSRNTGDPPSELKIFTLLLKINVKCGGQNFGLTYPIANQEEDVGLRGQTILMGADVFHPKTDDDTYSVAAVTATTDNDKFTYASRLKALDRNTEIMKEILTGMVKELLKVYRVNVGSYPQNIIFFRDGLSDSQYLDCLRVEGTAILQAVKEIQSEPQTEANFTPNVAIILAIKRHHTRFFVLHRGIVENLREGSVVSKIVTNLKDYDFFVASQRAPPKGTIRPTHYLVLLDQIRMQPGGGQGGLYNYVFNLCQTFQRCTYGVALVTPVSYAHLAAARAKLYMQDYKLEYTGQAFPKRDDARLSLDAHENLKNHLWFL